MICIEAWRAQIKYLLCKQWRSQPKNFYFWGGGMFDFRRITLFCLEKRLSKHKMTIFSKNLEGHGPFPPPWLRLCLQGSFLALRNSREAGAANLIPALCGLQRHVFTLFAVNDAFVPFEQKVNQSKINYSPHPCFAWFATGITLSCYFDVVAHLPYWVLSEDVRQVFGEISVKITKNILYILFKGRCTFVGLITSFLVFVFIQGYFWTLS